MHDELSRLGWERDIQNTELKMENRLLLTPLGAVQQITVVAGVARLRENDLRIPNYCQSGYIQIGK